MGFGVCHSVLLDMLCFVWKPDHLTPKTGGLFCYYIKQGQSAGSGYRNPYVACEVKGHKVKLLKNYYYLFIHLLICICKHS